MYRKFLLAIMAAAMLVTVAAPAFAEPPEPPVPGGDGASGEAITEGLPPATLQFHGPEGVTIHCYY